MFSMCKFIIFCSNIMSINFDCLYLNAEKDNSNSMLKSCINGSDDLVWPCSGNELIDNDIFSIVTERPQGDNIQGTLNHSLQVDSSNQKKDVLFENSNVEGFTNMGEKYVRSGDCPDGYFWCNKSNKCKQVCMNCKYNQRTYGKSKEFNEADPCFPNRGVYGGITNQGKTKCTCGENGQYCNDMFNAQGGMFVDKVFIMNVGDFGPLGKLAAY
jgi:hypothetical protein